MVERIDVKPQRPSGWWWAENDDWTPRLGKCGKVVYLFLRRCANSEGESFPSLPKIAWATEWGRTAVQSALAHLIALGAVTKVERPGRTPLYAVVGASGNPSAGRTGGASDPSAGRTPPVRRADDTRPRGGHEGLPSKETKGRTGVLSDARFLEELQGLYPGLDVAGEIRKCQAWLLTPRGRGKQLTRQRIVNWLNKCDAPVAAPRPAGPHLEDLPEALRAEVRTQLEIRPGSSVAEVLPIARRAVQGRT